MSTIKVLLVDDDRLALECLKTWLTPALDIQLVGLALSGEQCLCAIVEQAPDVVLLDLHMPALNGLDTLRQIVQQWPHIHVIIVSGDTSPHQLVQAVQAGARGYFGKDTTQQELVTAIRAVMGGQAAIAPQLVLHLLLALQRCRQPPSGTPTILLTDREQYILQKIKEGATNKEIGAEMFLTERTIKRAITDIFQKLGVQDRTHAVIYALQHDLIENKSGSAAF